MRRELCCKKLSFLALYYFSHTQGILGHLIFFSSMNLVKYLLFLVFLALKRPFIGHFDNHIDCDTPMPSASIHHIFMEINSLKFGQKHFTIPRFPAKKG